MNLNRRNTLKGLAASAAAVLSARSGLEAATGQTKSRALAEWPSVDVLVCGGGPAGIGAAMMAARQGAKTLLIERFGRLGGMAVQAMVGPLMGEVQSSWVEGILKRIGGRTVNYEFIDLKYADILREAGADFVLHTAVAEPLCEGNRVMGARILTKKGLTAVKAKVVVDATGDGDVAYGAGAEFDQGRGAGPNWPADGLVQPMSIMFRVSGVNNEETMEARGGRSKFRFPDGKSWDQVTKEANARGELPATVGKVRTYTSKRKDERVINATQVNRVDGTDVRDLTRAEIEGRQQVEPVLEFLRKWAPGFQKAYVSGVPFVVGVRETRRICGLETLTVRNVLEGIKSPQAVVQNASFGIDIHNPDGIGQAQGVSADYPVGTDPKGKPYDIPYGCLVPRDLEGLLVAGRCISGTHEAMASYRVQVIALSIGVAAGTAAALAASQNLSPRQVEVTKIQKIVFEETKKSKSK